MLCRMDWVNSAKREGTVANRDVAADPGPRKPDPSTKAGMKQILQTFTVRPTHLSTPAQVHVCATFYVDRAAQLCAHTSLRTPHRAHLIVHTAPRAAHAG